MRPSLLRILVPLWLAIFLVAASPLRAQVPELINYQGRLSSGGAPVSGPHTIIFSLYNSPTDAGAEWSETHTVEVDDGIFSVLLGSEASFPSGLFANSNALYLGVRVAGEPELSPRQRMVSTPYALRAGSVDEVGQNAITSAHIVDGSIQSADLAGDAAVLQLNGLSGDLTLVGAGGASVTSQGSTITITAGGGGGGGEAGVQSVQNADGALGISNPSGPTVTIDVQEGGITSAMLASDAVTGEKIADGSVAEQHLAEGAAVTRVNGLAGGVTLVGAGGTSLASDGNTITITSVTGGGGGEAGVQAIQSTGGAISVQNGTGPTVTLGINAGGISSQMLANDAVTSEKVAVGAIRTQEIADGTIATTDLADGAVNTVKIADGAVNTVKLADGAVNSAKITDGAVSSAKIGGNAVTNAHIANGTIQRAKLASDAAVTTLNALSGGVTLAGGGGTSISSSGNTITITSAAGGQAGVQRIRNTDGALDISNQDGPEVTINIDNGGITSAMIENGTIATADLGDNAVTSQKLADGAVGSQKLGDNAVTSQKIEDGAVTPQKFADGAITTNKIADAAVTSAKLGNEAVTSEKVASGAITTDHLADGAVTTGRIANAAVTGDKLAPFAALRSIRGMTGNSSGNINMVGSGGVSVSHDNNTNTITVGYEGVNSLNNLDGDIGIEGSGGISVNTNPGQRRITISLLGSSRRWKSDIEPLENALETVHRLQGVSYVWTESGRPDIGFIAEEVGAVLPEVVEYEENGVDARSVNYPHLVALLAEAIKEQQAQIEAQQHALQELTARMDAVESALTSRSDAPTATSR